MKRQSTYYLVGAALLHAGIWVFHFTVERPFVREMYLGEIA